MKEWLLENFTAASIVSVLTALGSFVGMIVCLVRTHKANKIIQDAKLRQTQVLCPKCHKKSPISDVHFVLPGGEIDDNLNGVPDHQE